MAVEKKKEIKKSFQEPMEEPKVLIAKKDFEICHNDYKRLIKAGDDLGDVPVLYHENLRTEEVL